MDIQEVKELLIKNDFIRDEFIPFSFNETTLQINKKPITHYNLYEKEGGIYLHLDIAIDVNEDYLVEVPSRKPLKIILTPLLSKQKAISLRGI